MKIVNEAKMTPEEKEEKYPQKNIQDIFKRLLEVI
jgi:hypothetical protein